VSLANTPPSSPTPTMALHFSGEPYGTVAATLIPFSVSTTTGISGSSPANSWYSDTCGDAQAVSSVLVASGFFDAASGHITDLSIRVTAAHSLAQVPTTSFLGKLVRACEHTHFSDEVASVALSTQSPGGSALTASGGIVLAGNGVVSSGASVGGPVSVVISGIMSPLPDRGEAQGPAGCVTVPDFVESFNLSWVSSRLQNLGLVPVYSWGNGPFPKNAWVQSQHPHFGACVLPGTKVYMTLKPGPRP
jgi:hypothetical protein